MSLFNQLRTLGLFHDVRTRLGLELENEEKFREQYSWMKSATKRGDDAVGELLTTKFKKRHQLNPALFESHLSEASALLDVCLARQARLTTLEAECINTALAYLSADELRPGTTAISKIFVESARIRAGGDPAQIKVDLGVLDGQDFINASLRELRIKMHSASGHPLNFGEQIDRLRELQADSIRSIHEKLTAADVGVLGAGIVKASSPGPMPEWDRESDDNLHRLIVWTRHLIRNYELGRSRELTYTKLVFLSEAYAPTTAIADPAVKLAEFRKLLTQAGRKTIPFKFNEDRPGTHRIVGIGAALVFENNFNEYWGQVEADQKSALKDTWLRETRSRFSFPARIANDYFHKRRDGNLFTFPIDAIELQNEVRVWEGSPQVRPIESNAIWNASIAANNRWSFEIDDVIMGPEGKAGTLSGIGAMSTHKLFTVKDVVVYLTVTSVPYPAD